MSLGPPHTPPQPPTPATPTPHTPPHPQNNFNEYNVKIWCHFFKTKGKWRCCLQNVSRFVQAWKCEISVTTHFSDQSLLTTDYHKKCPR